MLYESKADGSLAAHATQTKLRWQDGYVRHDHSIARALNRGRDFPEGDQTDFLEDHGFVARTAAIGDLVDPHAAYTLEYLDMILSLKAQNRRVVFVPTARLEFRIAEFSWRDVPYFMYKRSEATCHGTRDYLAKKWQAAFPNTGFWTYIKYTIVESHTYASLETLPLKYQLQLFLAFFQMAGYNRYDSVPYVEVLEAIDGGTLTTLKVNATRLTERKAVLDTVRKNATAADLLPQVGKSWLPALEADLPLEYMPFATMVFASPFTCDVVLVRARCPFSGSRRWRETCTARRSVSRHLRAIVATWSSIEEGSSDATVLSSRRATGRASSRGIYVVSPSRKVQASTATTATATRTTSTARPSRRRARGVTERPSRPRASPSSRYCKLTSSSSAIAEVGGARRSGGLVPGTRRSKGRAPRVRPVPDPVKKLLDCPPLKPQSCCNRD